MKKLQNVGVITILVLLFCIGCEEAEDDSNNTLTDGPTITEFSPQSGPSGTSVTILGTKFSPTATDNIVSFNGVQAIVDAAGLTSLTVIVPDNASTGKITVQVDGKSVTTSEDFVFITIPEVTTLAGSGDFGFADATGTAAQFYDPAGVAVDEAGNLFIADAENHRIRKITPGGIVTTFAGNGTAGLTDGAGLAAQFSSPRGVAIDKDNNLFVADGYNHAIRKITPAGVVTTLAGGGGEYGFADGVGASAKFYIPKGVAVDGAGNVYVADDINHRIRKITAAGVVTTLAGGGDIGAVDGVGKDASFNRPVGVAVDASGVVYVADALNNRIRMVSPAGAVTTLAGSGVYGFADGTGVDARFKTPGGIAVGPDGNIYIADTDNNRIRKITPAGVVSTLAGMTLPGNIDGRATIARFSSPKGITVDAENTVFVADRQNHSIRKIQ